MKEVPHQQGSHGEILRSTWVIGGGTLVSIIGGLVRQKAAAVIVGASGVGLIGLFQSFVLTTATFAGLGLPNAGTRQIAEAAAQDDPEALAAARRALFWGSLLLAGVAAAIVWLAQDLIASHLLDDPSLADEIGWLSIAVAASVVSASQISLLTGLRRIGAVARVTILSTAASVAVSVGALLLLGSAGLVVFVLAVPLSTLAVGLLYASRVPRPGPDRTPFRGLRGEWRVMVPLGLAMMAGGLVGMSAQLLVRILVHSEGGAIELGLYHAAATLSVTYLGLVLTAMGADYYPRLTAVIRDPGRANMLVNDQSEVALLLAGPALLLMMGIAPWIFHLLYAAEFDAAAPLLRWQLLGDIVKVASWPLGFLLLAAGRGRTYLLTELLASVVFVLVAWATVPVVGLIGAGVAVLVAYVAYLPTVYVLAFRQTSFSWSASVRRSLAVLAALGLIVFVAAQFDSAVGAAAGVIAAGALSVANFRKLKSALSGRLGPQPDPLGASADG